MAETTPKASTSNESEIKAPRHRSPNYPVIGLEAALGRAWVIYEAWKRAPVPVGTVHEKWEYKPHKGVGNQVVAALVAFGLLEVDGMGKMRKVKLSDTAYKILAGHPDKANLLQQAALAPPIYAEVWSKFGSGDLPPNETIAQYLRWERPDPKFNPASIPAFIADFRATIDYAKLTSGGIIPDEATSKDDAENAKNAASSGFDTGPFASLFRAPVKQPDKPPEKPKMLTDTFNLGGVTVALQYPTALNQASFADLKAWLELELRKIEREIVSAARSDLPPVPPPVVPKQ